MKHVKRSLILTILSVLSSGIMAQDILWDVDLTGFFDNREYKYPGQTSQTFFGNRDRRSQQQTPDYGRRQLDTADGSKKRRRLS